ncbi:hypothetical protein V8G54_009767 [Vigna mungo]|uniref:Retrotransposon gag domain-containing protein n=1 Tax=Vigna mungo TaxID=3915 RepID=A0AAQ3NV51_VIGMU
MTDSSSSHDELTKINIKLEQLLLSHANLSNTLHDLPLPPPFFEYHHTPPDQRIQIASFYLEGQALAWFQWMFNNGLLSSWEAFLRALELRFSPSKFDDPIAALYKLTQTQSLQEYLSDFSQTTRRQNSPIHPSSQPFWSYHHLPPPLSPSPSTPPKPLPPLLPTPTNKLPIKRLTEAEMQLRRDKNLCFNCDERYTRGHRCKPQFLLLTTFDSKNQDADVLSEDSTLADESPPEAGLISLHAFSGHWTPRTFRVTGSIQGYAVQILVDSGATHNFIQHRVAQFLHLPTQPTPSPLRVMVGNGEFLPCSSFCPNVTLTLDTHEFSIDLYQLELSGTDVVLGVHWLSMISPFVMDYNGPFMRFNWQQQLVELKGDSGPNPSPISVHQLRRLHNTNRVEALFQLTLESHPLTIPSSSNPSNT